jgi:prolyl-tRNA editing enzyme YbaK/EbsC (Cys-tRNA(Pro) deacylase)
VGRHFRFCGVRGTQVILRPEDYLRVTNAVMADIARGK